MSFQYLRINTIYQTPRIENTYCYHYYYKGFYDKCKYLTVP